MIARLPVLVAVLMAAITPLCAQDSDVTKYLEELRARSVPRNPQGDARQLLADFTKHLETTTDPAQRADLYMGISRAERTLGHADRAITAARSARSLQPGSTPIALGLADTLIENGQTGEVPALLAVDPTDGQALIHKADELAHNHPVIAIFCGELAHQLLPADQNVTDTLGTIYMWADQPSLAGTVFLQAIAAAPRSFDIPLPLRPLHVTKRTQGRGPARISGRTRMPPLGRRAIRHSSRAQPTGSPQVARAPSHRSANSRDCRTPAVRQ